MVAAFGGTFNNVLVPLVPLPQTAIRCVCLLRRTEHAVPLFLKTKALNIHQLLVHKIIMMFYDTVPNRPMSQHS